VTAGFQPKLVGKRQTELAGSDDKILGLYAGGMIVRDISAHPSERYGAQIGRDRISAVIDAVPADARRTRPLEAVYPIAYFDAMQVRVREDRLVRDLVCDLALGVNCDGIAGVDGLKGLPEAIEATFPQTGCALPRTRTRRSSSSSASRSSGAGAIRPPSSVARRPGARHPVPRAARTAAPWASSSGRSSGGLHSPEYREHRPRT
jgi:transposase-like protein